MPREPRWRNKVVMSPTIITSREPCPSPDGEIAFLMFPYTGKVGKGYVEMDLDIGEESLPHLEILYKSPTGVEVKRTTNVAKGGDSSFMEFYDVEEGGRVTIRVVDKDGNPKVTGITNIRIGCAFLPLPSPEMIALLGDENAPG